MRDGGREGRKEGEGGGEDKKGHNFVYRYGELEVVKVLVEEALANLGIM